MRFLQYVAIVGLVTSLGAAGIAPASAQLIDAGQQAMIMHQGNLLEQQTAPNRGKPAKGKSTKRGATVKSTRSHQRACAARYRSYDSRTDTFLARPGVRLRCKL